METLLNTFEWIENWKCRSTYMHDHFRSFSIIFVTKAVPCKTQPVSIKESICITICKGSRKQMPSYANILNTK